MSTAMWNWHAWARAGAGGYIMVDKKFSGHERESCTLWDWNGGYTTALFSQPEHHLYCEGIMIDAQWEFKRKTGKPKWDDRFYKDGWP